MKRRFGSHLPSEQDEQQALEGLKEYLAGAHDVPGNLPAAHWANLIVKTNQRIDEATSAKALSISWAARVAIPGVVAILFFFIGLHYYAPNLSPREGSVASLINTLPVTAVDSILVNPEGLDVNLSEEDVSTDIFQFSSDQISEYLVVKGNMQTAVDVLDDSDVAVLLAALDKEHM
jgi:hypothetical protein